MPLYSDETPYGTVVLSIGTVLLFAHGAPDRIQTVTWARSALRTATDGTELYAAVDPAMMPDRGIVRWEIAALDCCTRPTMIRPVNGARPHFALMPTAPGVIPAPSDWGSDSP